MLQKLPTIPACLAGLLRLLCAAFLAGGLALPAAAATIDNTAAAAFGGPGGNRVVNSNTTTLQSLPPPSPSLVTFYQFAPGVTGSSTIPFAGAAYDDTGNGDYLPLQQPVSLAGNPISLAFPVEVRPTHVFHAGEPVFVTLADANRNTDPTVVEEIVLTITTSNGDTETLRLRETGPDTGLFSAAIPSSNPRDPRGSASLDGRLAVDINTRLTVDYQDIYYPQDTSETNALVDPFGVLFDSVTGLPLDGATITMIDVATGLPATVFGDDGVSAFPATLTTGGGATDSSGFTYTFPAGGFRFPFVFPGNYRFDVTPPLNYTVPSTVAPGSMPPSPGGDPYSVVAGSFGDVFVVLPGPALNIDIPADPQVQTLVLQKQVSQTEASAGDFLQYRLSLRNTDALVAATATTLLDRLPVGMRYEAGSLRVDGVAVADPAIAADGRTMTLTLGNIAPSATMQITYVVQVAAGVAVGNAVNEAQASANGGSILSNSARVAVAIREPLMSGRFTLIGRVFEGDCGTPWEELKGVANARVMLEDGTYVVTDADGQYHVEGLHPGTHVVQLDIGSLPGGLEAVSCIDNTRFAGSAYSQFVDVRGGGLWRADFHVRPRGEAVGIRVQTKLAFAQPATGETATGAAAAAAAAEAVTPAPGAAIAPVAAPARGLRTETVSVHFDSCEAAIKPADDAAISALVGKLAGEDMAGVEVVGHADARTMTARCAARYTNNQVLSEARARVVADRLAASFGFRPEQVLVSGQGATRPVASNKTAQGRARNRRADVELRFHYLQGQGAAMVAPATANASSAPAPAAATAADVPAAQAPAAPASGRVSAIENRIDVDGSGGVAELNVIAVLPAGHAFEAGSVTVDGVPAADPAIDGTMLTFGLGDVVGEPGRRDWKRVIAFRARPVAPVAPAPAPEPAAAPLREVRTVALQAQFDSCRASLQPAGEADVERLVRQVEGKAIARVELVGHTDNQRLSPRCREQYADNHALSRARARAIGDILAARLGLREEQVVADGKGPDKPVASNATAAGMARNRRTEVRFFFTDALDEAPAATAVPAAPAAAAACAADYALRAMAHFGGNGERKREKTPTAESRVACPTAAAPDAPLESVSERQSVAFSGATVRAPDADVVARLKARQPVLDDQAAAGTHEPWMRDLKPGTAWLFPATGHNPRAPATRIAVSYPSTHRLTLRREDDGSEVSGLSFDGVRKSADEKTAVSVWRGVPLQEGHNVFVATVTDAAGNVVETLRNDIYYGYAPARAEFVEAHSILRADGMTRPVVAVRILDREGRPVRSGMTGPVTVNAPYTLWHEIEKQQQRALAGLDRFEARYQVAGDDGMAYIELAPTTESGAVELGFEFPAGNAGSRTQQLRTWVSPAPRDWVVVGFAEGTLGYNTLKDNIQPLLAEGVEDGAYADGQVSLYAKGRVRGDWLATIAFDSDRSDERDRQKALLSQIDPNEYYTLYGDGSEQRDDAPSQDNLYLKLERGQFYALFGDYETGLTQAKLMRYSRTLNGLKVENGGGPVTYTAFAAETPQTAVHDEIQGNGTSGLYRLSQRGIVLNGERIRIETRDRVHSQNILSSKILTRHIDYDIDYSAGTVFFRRPVPSRDPSFNPVFIVAEYETLGVASEQLNAGGRVAFAMGDEGKVAVGVSAIRDDNNLGATDLVGTDVKVRLGTDTELRVEAAVSDGSRGLVTREGDAWLAELEHHDGKYDALLYTRRIDSAFGVSQQSAADTGMLKTGVDGQVRLDDVWSLQGEAYTQENLGTADQRDGLAGKLLYQGDEGGFGVGAQVIKDQAASGGLAGQSFRSEQLTVNGNRWVLDRKVELIGQIDTALGGNRDSVDFPNRYLLGANYKLNDHARLLFGQEFTDGRLLDTSTTRAGFEVIPWAGARLDSTLNQAHISEYGPRTFGQFGLTQAVLVNERWGLDFAVDASETFNESAQAPLVVNPAHPVTPGGTLGPAGVTEDFHAFSAGATWRRDLWSWNGRVETRDGETTDRHGLVTGFLRQAEAGVAYAASAKAFRTEQVSGTQGVLASLDFSLAWRPLGEQWSVLDRLEFRYEDVENGTGVPGSELFGNNGLTAGKASIRRVINNLAINRVSRAWTGADRTGNLFNRYERNQWSLYYGMKYAMDTFDGVDYDGYTDLLGVEVRHDINPRWDVGVQASALNAWSAGTHAYSIGPMVGWSPVKNGWVTLGYNVRGFTDEDFDAARYTAQGPYLQLRLKFDQNTRWGKDKEEATNAVR